MDRNSSLWLGPLLVRVEYRLFYLWRVFSEFGGVKGKAERLRLESWILTRRWNMLDWRAVMRSSS